MIYNYLTVCPSSIKSWFSRLAFCHIAWKHWNIKVGRAGNKIDIVQGEALSYAGMHPDFEAMPESSKELQEH
jgi:hypothetical protein